jgi:nucleoside-diphosphate-sugar epimerase
MRVFVTGASGHIGCAVVPELIGAGHQVVGLARSDTSAAALEAAGAEVHRGNLDDLDSLGEAAAAADGVIHLAFKHEEMRSGALPVAIAAELAAIRALGAALEGSDKPLVGTSGTLMLAHLGITDRPGTERDAIADVDGSRVEAENAMIALSQRGVRSSVVRLAPIVHSTLDHHGFTHALIAIARHKGVAGYVGDGSNRWPAAHTLDIARLYRLALERAEAGSRLHGVADEGIPFREIAQAIGRKLGLPATSIAPEQAAEHFGYLGALVPLDNPTSNAITRRQLDWEPTRPGLMEDLDLEHYFAQGKEVS